MSFDIDDTTFHTLVGATLDRVDPYEIRAVITALELAASVALDEEPEEDHLVNTLTLQLCQLADIDPASLPQFSPLPTDDEERARHLGLLKDHLPSAGARELALVLSDLVIVVDLELGPVESRFLNAMRTAFEIPSARAAELFTLACSLVTPPELTPAAAGAARRSPP